MPAAPRFCRCRVNDLIVMVLLNKSRQHAGHVPRDAHASFVATVEGPQRQAMSDHTHHLESYRIALQSILSHPRAEDELRGVVRDLRQFYGINDEEHQIVMSSLDRSEATSSRHPLIVVIEDEPTVRQYVLYVLRTSYPMVSAFDHAEPVIALLEGGTHVDLIISDVHLGDGFVNGVEFAQRLRAGSFGSHHAEIPVILMSANADLHRSEPMPVSGRCLFLSKPFSREALERALQGALA